METKSRTSLSLKELQASHTREAIRWRLQKGPRHSYLKDFVYGAVDGAVTTFAVVCGVAGAQLSSEIVIIMGLANLIGDGFSMAVGSFLSTRAEQDFEAAVRKIEELHIKEIPDGEREEIRQIFAEKGFSGKDLENIVGTITANRELWINTMLREEHGFSLHPSSPHKAAFATFSAFVLVGLLPLAAFIANLAFFSDTAFSQLNIHPFPISVLMTALAFFTVGAFKSRYVLKKWWHSGLETLFLGGTAAALAYAVASMLRNIAS